MNELKIVAICEANSMQPSRFTVGNDYDYNRNKKIDRIVEEDVFINGDPYPFYVGYDQFNERIFEFKKGTVNVFY